MSRYVDNDPQIIDLESDLPSLANQAAIECDNLVVGRGEVKVEAVRRLSSLLSEAVTTVDQPDAPASALNPQTAVVLHLAINDSNVEQVTELQDLLVRARQIKVILDALVADPRQFSDRNPQELKSIRTFCVALSKRAAAASHFTFEEKQRHPFRK